MKAGGEGFFATADTYSYQPRGILIGQATEESCVPACVRMMLLDEFPFLHGDYRVSESFLRNALETTRKGSSVANVPAVLHAMGATKSYIYRADLTLPELQKTAESYAAMAVLRTTFPQSAHVVLVEQVTETMVAMRDPLPLGQGSAYTVALPEFLKAWTNAASHIGCAVIVLE